jgi:hypothetical protein
VRGTDHPPHARHLVVRTGTFSCAQQSNQSGQGVRVDDEGALDRVQLEIQANRRNIVQGSLPQVEPLQLVGGGVLKANRADLSTRGNLTRSNKIISAVHCKCQRIMGR